jgi:hypothetical protein
MNTMFFKIRKGDGGLQMVVTKPDCPHIEVRNVPSFLHWTEVCDLAEQTTIYNGTVVNYSDLGVGNIVQGKWENDCE